MRLPLLRIVVTMMVLATLGVLSGCSGGSGNSDTYTPPAGSPAQPLHLTVTPGSGLVSLAWTPVSGATSYTVYWAASPDVSRSSTIIPDITGTGYTHTGLANGTRYYYRITASNAAGESVLSDEVSAVPQGTAPAAPGILSAAPGNSQTTIVWSSSPGASAYNLYWNTSSPVSSSSSKISGLTGTTFNHTGLSANGRYYYRLSAVNEYGESPLSTEISAKTASGLSLSITVPAIGTLSDDPLAFVVVPTSTYEVTSLLAQLENDIYPLVYSSCAASGRYGCTPGWGASIPMGRYQRGLRTISVTATDAAGSTASATSIIDYDKKPLVSVASPADHQVLREPSVRISASCSDDDPAGCTSVSAYANGSLLATVAGGVMDKTFSLNGQDGDAVTIRVDVTDSRNQTVSTSRTVHVETLAGFSEVATVPGDIFDFSPDRILYVDSNSGVASLKIRSVSSGSDTLVARDSLQTPQRGGLTPTGAMYTMKGSTGVYGTIYDYRSGASENLGFPESSFTIAGSYAIWFGYDLAGTSDYLYLRDFAAGTTTGLVKYNLSSGYNPSKGDFDVAANGDAVYWTNYIFDTNVIRVRNGVSTRITNDLGASSGIPLWYQNMSPKTDGINVCYLKREYRNPGGAGATSLYLHDGTREVQLSAPFTNDSYGSTSSFQYRLNNGWTAYTKPGLTNQSQIWLRAADGTSTQVTYFSTSSSIVFLAHNGEMMISNSGELYLFKPGQTGLIYVASSQARPAYFSGAWYFVVGRTLFR